MAAVHSGTAGGLILAEHGEPVGWEPWRCQSASASLSSTCCNGTDGTTPLVSSRSPKTVSEPQWHYTARTPNHGH